MVVAETLGDVTSIAGGLPTSGPDTYNHFNGLTNRLAIPAVQVGEHVYTNVVVKAGKPMAGRVYAANQESVLYSFTGDGQINGGPKDGAAPFGGLIQGSDGNFYGTTRNGGIYNMSIGSAAPVDAGTVFKLTPAGAETIIYSFCNSNEGGVISGCLAGDGANPSGSLIQDSHGNLYGTTINGGASNAGTVFRITPAGAETVLYSFQGINEITGSTDGANPYAGLVVGSDDNLYGTTYAGGKNGAGTVFSLTLAGVETVLYSFCPGGLTGNCPDGDGPAAALIQGSDGNFYGTTEFGGVADGGVVFRIAPADNDAETVFYAFAGAEGVSNPDGYAPRSSLIQGSDGNLYGTTSAGGPFSTAAGGNVFKITPAGVYTSMYSFFDVPDGAAPYGGLTQASDGNFYGTTYHGGVNNAGTLFKITPTGVETVLYSFSGGGYVNGSVDGAQPVAGVIQASDGNFYGTALYGGPCQCATTGLGGVAFKVTNLALAH